MPLILPTHRQDAAGLSPKCNVVKELISRRSLIKVAGVGAIGLAAGPLKAQESPTAGVEALLAAKLDDRAKELLAGALRSNATASRSRLRHKLVENSEPCTIFQAEVPKK